MPVEDPVFSGDDVRLDEGLWTLKFIEFLGYNTYLSETF